MADNQVYDDPYSDKNPDWSEQTPPMDQVIREAIRSAMLDVFFMRPAVVTKVHGNQKVNVQVLLKRVYTDGTEVKLAAIQNVMVSMPMGDGWSIKYPLAVGCRGMAIFCDRSLDNWSNSDGGFVDPVDTRAHDLSDPVFVPGLAPFAQQTTDSTDDMVLTNGDAQVHLAKAGTFKLKGAGGQELLNNLVNLVDTLSTASTVAGGPFIPSVVTLLNQIKANLQQIMET